MTFTKALKGSNKQWEKWLMADDTIITVDQMTEQHAKNCLNLLLKRIRLAEEASFKKVMYKEINQMEKGMGYDFWD